MKYRKNNASSRLAAAMRGFAALALALVLMLSLFACGGEKTMTGDNDPKRIIASIGDEKVNLALFNALFDTYVEYWQQMGADPFTSAEDLERFQDTVLDALISDVVVLHHAHEEGFVLTEDQTAEVEEAAKGELESIKNDYTALAERAAEQEPALSVQAHFDKLIAELSEYYTGEAMSFEAYSNEYTKEMLNSRLIEEYRSSVIAGFDVTEAQLADWYQKQYESDEALYNEKPEQFLKDAELFERFGGESAEYYPPTYVPEGYFRVMDIMVRPSGELGEEYESKHKELTALGEECASLLFNDALNGTNANAGRVAELIEEYKKLDEETRTLYESYIGEAKAKLERAVKELEDGADFRETMLKYTENELVSGEQAVKLWSEKGQLITLEHENAGGQSATFKDVFSMLKEGERSSIFTDEDGSLHVILRCAEEKPGRVELNEIRDAVAFIVRSERGESDWNELVDAWCDDTAIKVDRDAVRHVGREKLKSK